MGSSERDGPQGGLQGVVQVGLLLVLALGVARGLLLQSQSLHVWTARGPPVALMPVSVS
jgi:hypothetical protein